MKDNTLSKNIKCCYNCRHWGYLYDWMLGEPEDTEKNKCYKNKFLQYDENLYTTKHCKCVYYERIERKRSKR